MSRGRIWAYQYWIPALVLLLGGLSIGMVLWSHRISERQWLNFGHLDAITGVRTRTATVHLWFDEAIASARQDDAKKILPDLDAAVKLSRALLHGGHSDLGVPLPPPVAVQFRSHAETLAALVAEFKEIAFKLHANPEARRIGSAVDQRFDVVFGEVQKTARALEILAKKNLVDEYAKTERLLFAAVLTWTSVVLASTVGFYTRERRRRQAELALAKMYDEMEERVLARTAELAEANEQLQEEIAERRRTEDILRQSEEEFRGLSVQFRTLLDTMPDRITLVSRDLKVLWANRGAGVLSSAVAADPAGEYCRVLWHDGSRPCNGCPAATSFSTGKPANARMSTPDGGQWEMRTVPIVREDGTIESVLEVATDITEKLALQAETMRAAHLASIGELAAGVAHEINSPINGIINYAQILCNKSPAGSSARDLASRILKEGNRIGDIVRGLLTFARERKEERRPVGVTDILSESLALTRAQMKAEGIVLLIHVPPHLSEIVANPQQIQQVFMNIINNARYALNQKYQGAHKNKILQIRGESMREGGVPYVRVTFRDRGVGIPAHLVNKVMEPFFSTKPSGNGTGLGLSVSHGIISDHHGRVTIESVEGEFTNVLVDLPARESAHGDDPRGR